jgi:DNA (cytosine-5)-methyltransferase 1
MELIKPQYNIPSMEEINKIPKEFKVVSTFSGCGGSSLGYKMAGLNVIWANEFVEAAQEVYKLNHKNTILNKEDIRTLAPENILNETKLDVGEIDILDGSPPCASFSTSGQIDKGWNEIRSYSDTKQYVDDLFFEFLRIAKGLQPKVIVGENVKGLVTGKAKGYFKLILKEFKDIGYNVKAKVLKADRLGVPTMRERLIFVATRNDLNIEPSYPKPKKYKRIVADAYTDQIEGEHNTVHNFAKLLWARAVKENNSSLAAISKKYYGKDRYFSHRIVFPHNSCNTLTTTASHYHHKYPRTLTIPEVKAISSFPKDFKLTGSFTKQWERIGRAVPPLMMKEVASAIKKDILYKL